MLTVSNLAIRKLQLIPTCLDVGSTDAPGTREEGSFGDNKDKIETMGRKQRNNNRAYCSTNSGQWKGTLESVLETSFESEDSKGSSDEETNHCDEIGKKTMETTANELVQVFFSPTKGNFGNIMRSTTGGQWQSIQTCLDVGSHDVTGTREGESFDDSAAEASAEVTRQTTVGIRSTSANRISRRSKVERFKNLDDTLETVFKTDDEGSSASESTCGYKIGQKKHLEMMETLDTNGRFSNMGPTSGGQWPLIATHLDGGSHAVEDKQEEKIEATVRTHRAAAAGTEEKWQTTGGIRSMKVYWIKEVALDEARKATNSLALLE